MYYNTDLFSFSVSNNHDTRHCFTAFLLLLLLLLLLWARRHSLRMHRSLRLIVLFTAFLFILNFKYENVILFYMHLIQ
jgi:MYXO-CTERM domain-containing protein